MKKNPGSGFHTVRGYQLKKQQAGGLTPALEDYLEMVYRLCLEEKYARVGKLSSLLHVKPSSTSKMILKLVDLGYLEYDSYESILLTDTGRKTGAYLLERHETIEQFLMMLESPNPLEEAELMEHTLSVATVSAMNRLVAFMAENPEIAKKYKAFSKQTEAKDAPKRSV